MNDPDSQLHWDEQIIITDDEDALFQQVLAYWDRRANNPLNTNKLIHYEIVNKLLANLFYYLVRHAVVIRPMEYSNCRLYKTVNDINDDKNYICLEAKHWVINESKSNVSCDYILSDNIIEMFNNFINKYPNINIEYAFPSMDNKQLDAGDIGDKIRKTIFSKLGRSSRDWRQIVSSRLQDKYGEALKVILAQSRHMNHSISTHLEIYNQYRVNK